MSVFRNVRIYPAHGTRSATVTWEMAPGTPAGDVYVAFSPTGTPGTWTTRNTGAPASSAVGTYADTELVMQGAIAEGYYKLLLQEGGNDHFSEVFRILGDLTPREYGIIRAMIHREFTIMKAVNGFPVWHCIPRTFGPPASGVDPDDGLNRGIDCPGSPDDHYDLAYEGGFFRPVLTWISLGKSEHALRDEEGEATTRDDYEVPARMMAFPRPSRGHMLVDPATDRRYLVGDKVDSYDYRGVMPVAYDVKLDFLHQNDALYRFQPPSIDTKAYRSIPYWSPA